ncbi:MAG: hypothetical protein IKB01_14890 [Lachnospiraceae bacterium]|nr:hypothetical protein [Lachnospiraceae bacterium]
MKINKNPYGTDFNIVGIDNGWLISFWTDKYQTKLALLKAVDRERFVFCTLDKAEIPCGLLHLEWYKGDKDIRKRITHEEAQELLMELYQETDSIIPCIGSTIYTIYAGATVKTTVTDIVYTEHDILIYHNNVGVLSNTFKVSDYNITWFNDQDSAAQNI